MRDPRHVNPMLCCAMLYCVGGVLLSLSTASTASVGNNAPSSLNVGIVNCHTSGFKKILPQLERRLHRKINMYSGTSEQIYQQLNQQKLDLIINHNSAQMNQAVSTGQILAGSVKVIDEVEPVLWCPSSQISYRVSALATLAQPQIKRLANTTSPHLPMTHVLQQLGPLPKNIRIVSVAHPYAAMQAVQQGHADCAILSQRMVVNDKYQPLTQSRLVSMIAIPRQTKDLKLSKRLAYELERPVMRAKLELTGFSTPSSPVQDQSLDQIDVTPAQDMTHQGMTHQLAFTGQP